MAALSQARHQAEAEVDDYIANNTHRVLMQGDTPLGALARIPVPDLPFRSAAYTPPVMRGAGIARSPSRDIWQSCVTQEQMDHCLRQRGRCSCVSGNRL